jgi:hypothetical protein
MSDTTEWAKRLEGKENASYYLSQSQTVIKSLVSEIDHLEKKNEILSSTLSDLLFHLMDYNTGEESLVLAMEIERAREAIGKIKEME